MFSMNWWRLKIKARSSETARVTVFHYSRQDLQTLELYIYMCEDSSNLQRIFVGTSRILTHSTDPTC